MLAEYLSKYKAGISLIFAILFSLINLISQSSAMAKSADKAAAALDFFSETFHSLGNGIVRILDSYGNYNVLKRERDALRNKLEIAQDLQLQLEILETENTEYRELLKLKGKVDYPMVTAEIISMDPDNWFRTIIINKGANDGIEPYMPVIGYQVDVKEFVTDDGEVLKSEQIKVGVVGKIIQVTPTSARVLPITDNYSKLGVKVKRTGHWAMISGQSQKKSHPRLEYLSLSVNLKPGDYLVTSGDQGVFPRNIPVGVVSGEIVRGATFQEALVAPIVDVQKIQNVMIIQKKVDDPKRDFPDVNPEMLAPDLTGNQLIRERDRAAERERHSQKPAATTRKPAPKPAQPAEEKSAPPDKEPDEKRRGRWGR